MYRLPLRMVYGDYWEGEDPLQARVLTKKPGVTASTLNAFLKIPETKSVGRPNTVLVQALTYFLP